MTKKRILGCLRVHPAVRVPPVEYHWCSLTKVDRPDDVDSNHL
jgi:hypothetical protein